MRGKDGHLHRRVKVRVILPEGHKPHRFVAQAEAGRGFTGSGVDQVLEAISDQIEERFPHWEFRLVPVGPNAFNFIYAGLREQPTDNQCAELRAIKGELHP